MRVTQLNTFRRLKHYLEKNRKMLFDYQMRLASGKRVTKASDDSVAYTTSRQLENIIRKEAQYQNNISSGLAKATTAEDALQNIVDILSKANTLIVKGATDSIDEDARQILGEQIQGLKKEIVSLTNTKFNDVYLFGGTNTQNAPFSLAPGSPTSVNDTSNGTALKVQVSDISSLTISVSGDAIRNIGGGDDLFAVLKNAAQALRNNNATAIRNSLDKIDEAYDHVVSLSSKLANHINRLNFLNKQIEDQQITQKGRVSEMIDADFVKVMSHIQESRTSYRATLMIHSRISRMSLLNYL